MTRAAALAALGLCVALWLPWYSVPRPPEVGPATVNGWEAFTRLDAALFAAGVLALLAPAFVPRALARAATAALGAGAALAIAYKIADRSIIPPLATATQAPADFVRADGVRLGAYVALLAAGVLALTGAMALRRERSLAWPPERVTVAGLVALAAVLRFAGLGEQSYWYDELATVQILSPGLGGAVDAYLNTESTPPLYYVLAWPWVQLLGTDEAVLRSLSALFGTLAVPVTYLAGRRLVSGRAGLAAAAVVAVNPTLLWYSQEARAYSLLVLMGALTLLALARALAQPSRRNVALWGLAAALALLTHYFALFLVAVEGLVLAYRVRSRVLLAAAALPAAAVALLPLAGAQDGGERANFIATIPLGERVDAVARELLTANTLVVNQNTGLPGETVGYVVGAVLVLAVLAALERHPRRAALPLALGLGALTVPLLLAPTRFDYLLDRNLLPAWIALAIGLGALLAALPRWAERGVLAVVLAGGLLVNLQVFTQAGLQRADWRSAVAVLGERPAGRAVVVTPSYARGMLPFYGVAATPLAAAGIRTDEIDVLGNFTIDGPYPAVPGFAPTGARQLPQVGAVALRAPEPVVLTPASLVAAGVDPGSVMVDPSDRAADWYAAYFARLEAWRRALADDDPAALPARAAAIEPPPADVPGAAGVTARILAADAAAARWAQDDAARPAFEAAARRVPGGETLP